MHIHDDSPSTAPPPEQPPPLPPQSWPGIGGSLLLVFMVLVFQIGLGAGLGALSVFVGTGLVTHPLMLGLLNLIAMGIALRVGLAMAPYPVGEVLGLRRFPLSWLVPATIGIVGLQILASDLINLLFYLVPPPEQLTLPNELLFGQEGTLWAVFITVVVIAPLTEEPLCRGLMIHGIRGRRGAVVAVVVSAVLFGVLHVSPWHAAPTALIGLVLGWWRVAGGSLWLCIYGHLVNNLVAFAGGSLLPFEIPGFTSPPTEGAVFQPLWFTASGAVLAGVGFFWLWRAFSRQCTTHAAETPSTEI